VGNRNRRSKKIHINLIIKLKPMEKMYRVKRFETPSGLADAVALLCAKSNGCVWEKLTIDEIAGYIECERKLYPSINNGVAVTRITDYHCIVDQGVKPLIEIMEVEVFNEVPTLDVYDQSQN
jgi:hypothetical protein